MTLLLVTVAHPQLVEHAHPRLGRLLVPDHYPRARDTAEAGIPWAADNGAFSGFDEDAFVRMLDAIEGLDGCRFVTSPDVVGDARSTVDLLEEWSPRIRSRGLPVAMATQDGLGDLTVPWSLLDAIFVGGTNAYKLSTESVATVREALNLGRWIHMGRVNGRRRYDLARALGVHSVDGSSFARFRSTWLDYALSWGDEPLQGVLT